MHNSYYRLNHCHCLALECVMKNMKLMSQNHEAYMLCVKNLHAVCEKLFELV